MSFSRSRFITSLLASAVLIGASACSGSSDDNSADNSSNNVDATTTTTAAPSTDNDTESGDSGSGGSAGDSDRAFGIDDSGLAETLQRGLSADEVQIDGNTFRVIYSEGSIDSPTAAMNCRVSVDIAGADDVIVLVFPDGELNCSEN